MAVNKVEINGEVKLDLTADTVTAAKLAQGETAHDASGKLITGTMTAPQLQIVVTTSAGATVTATKGSKTVSGTADASGNCTLTVDETGTWSVVAELNDVSRSVDVTVGTNAVFLQMVNPVFANNDWATIIKLCQENKVPDTWNVGDSCNMTINKKTYRIDIIGKNHDDYADGSGKAPLTFQMHDCYATKYYMCGTQDNSYGWERSMVRENTACPTIKKNMPAEVAAALKAVTKKTTAGGSSSSIVTTQDTLFCLSEIEVYGTRTYSYAGEGTQYAYYKGKTAAEIAKKRSGSIESCWLRSPKSYDTKNYCIIHWDGEADYYTADTTVGVAVAFCF